MKNASGSGLARTRGVRRARFRSDRGSPSDAQDRRCAYHLRRPCEGDAQQVSWCAAEVEPQIGAIPNRRSTCGLVSLRHG